MIPLLSARLRLLAVLLLLGPLAGCGTQTTNLVTGETTRGAYTWAQEVQIGQEADGQIVAQFGLVDDPGLAAYVDRIGQAVLQTSAYGEATTPAEIRNTPFYFRVLDTDVVNAFALPGGYTYVTRGLLSHLENEAQLAVVLGHEIGHVLARHQSRSAAKAQLGQLGLLGAAVLGGVVGGGDVAQGVLEYGGTGVQLLFLKYGRDAERESDLAGVAYAEYAGYDAAEAAAFFRSLERLSQEAGGGPPSFLSTHPDPEERERTIPQLAAQYDTGTAVNEEQFLSQIDGIVLGNDPRQGFAEDGRFYHPELRFVFDYPDRWGLFNGAAAVQIAEPNGAAIMEFTFAQDQSSAAAAGRAFAGQQGFQATESGGTTVNGFSAYTVSGTANSQQGALGVVAYFIEQGDNVYRFMGLTGSSSLGTYRGEFLRTMRSFAPLTDGRYLNRQPVRLEVVTVQRATPFQRLLDGRTMPLGMDEGDLAIMNGVELNQTIPAGEEMKLPAD